MVPTEHNAAHRADVWLHHVRSSGNTSSLLMALYYILREIAAVFICNTSLIQGLTPLVCLFAHLLMLLVTVSLSDPQRPRGGMDHCTDDTESKLFTCNDNELLRGLLCVLVKNNTPRRIKLNDIKESFWLT